MVWRLLLQMLAGVLGFLMYKVALVGVTTIPGVAQEPVVQAKRMEADQR